MTDIMSMLGELTEKGVTVYAVKANHKLDGAH